MAKKKKSNVLEEFDFFDIDKTRLDEEWVNQPKLFFKYAAELALAQKRELESRADREVVKAELSIKIRKDPKKYGLDKLTEAGINNIIMMQSEYKEEQSSLLKKRYKIGLLQAAVNALYHRKSALERLVMLHGQNYFSQPQAKDENSKEIVGDIEKKTARKRTKKSRSKKT